MLTLITQQKEFETLLGLVDWDNAYVKESHYAASQFLSQNLQSDSDCLQNSCDSSSLLLLLLALPEESSALEIVSFDPEFYSFLHSRDLEEDPMGIITRRRAEIQLGGVYCAVPVWATDYLIFQPLDEVVFTPERKFLTSVETSSNHIT